MTDLANTAIIAGGGRLPLLLAEACLNKGAAYRVVTFEGAAPDWAADGHPVIHHPFEALGALFGDLKEAGISKVVFAGGMARPALDPSRADAAFMAVAPQLMAALQQGDDATLRFILSLFEDQGFHVVGAHEVLPELLLPDGCLTDARPMPDAVSDADRAAEIVAKLGEADVGQAAVVAGGICLAVETIGGTDRMLEAVATLPAPLRGKGGVLYKAAKPGQDLRVDMPAIGPGTVAAAAAAGLSGIVVLKGEVLTIDASEIREKSGKTGIFVWVRSR